MGTLTRQGEGKLLTPGQKRQVAKEIIAKLSEKELQGLEWKLCVIATRASNYLRSHRRSRKTQYLPESVALNS